jgi:hypothetical protein
LEASDLARNCIEFRLGVAEITRGERGKIGLLNNGYGHTKKALSNIEHHGVCFKEGLSDER